jgi:uncharacterized membrane protein YbhN (UPF0104 family)
MVTLQLQNMQYYLSYKSKQFFVVLIKLSIIISASYFVYYKLTQDSRLSWPLFLDFVSKNNIFSFKNLFVLFLLSFCNWFLEILKWKYFANAIHNTSFKSALAQSLGALTASLFTPNRIGEYGAKAMYFTAPHRKKIMFATLLSHLLQMSVTLILGCLGLYSFIQHYALSLNSTKLVSAAIAIVLLSLGGFIFLKTNRFTWPLQTRIAKALKHFSKSLLVIGFLLSLTRYMVFSFQFYSLLVFFKIELSYWESMSLITTSYLISSLIPTIFIFDVVLKGSVAVFLFTFAQVNELVVLSITTLMWSFNFVLPSIVGCFYVITFTPPKALVYDSKH